MTLFKCIRKDSKGYVSESLFRNGESEKEVLEGLEMFCWPEKGTWTVEEPEKEYDFSWNTDRS